MAVRSPALQRLLRRRRMRQHNSLCFACSPSAPTLRLPDSMGAISSLRPLLCPRDVRPAAALKTCAAPPGIPIHPASQRTRALKDNARVFLQATDRIDAWASALARLRVGCDTAEIDEDVEQLFRANHLDDKQLELCDMTAEDLAKHVSMSSVSCLGNARACCHHVFAENLKFLWSGTRLLSRCCCGQLPARQRHHAMQH